ncbi:Tubulin polyglutamylase TTLL5 [Phytophthora citrophthora]|uniref:Tubulin--tyrosine ligase-like protein 5 n=1 Tax=Phytophthora citrophthora TaxID=4793 RepID=A0AAD9GY64_9STRA|nr:Tubulin polyglutamylase TTLL5 [Phytophthora citrophthora]
MATSLQPRRPVALSLLVLTACINLCTVVSVRTQARFYLPEPAQQQKLSPVLQQLEALGISQFKAADTQSSWGKLQSDSAEFDLVWSVDAAPPFAQLELPNQFNAKVNHLPGAEKLTSPDALAQHLTAQKKKHVKFFFDFSPAHFELPRDQALLTSAYTEARKKSDFSPKRVRDSHVHQRFLLRERAVNGDDASTQRAEVFVTDADLQFKLQSNTFKGKTVVVNQYVEPLLLDNHKFRVGFYVAITSTDPLRVYVYDHPLIQIAKSEYPSTLNVESDPAAYNFDQYIAPWDFPDLQADFHELPSATREGTNAWHVLKKHLRRQGVDTKHLQDEVDAAIAKVVISSRGHFQSEQSKVKRTGAEGTTPSELSDSFFDLWRFEFEFDDMAKPWLIRVVSNPSMEGTQSVLATDEAIKKRLLHDLLNLVGVHPQARLPFEKFYRPGADTSFCSDKCGDKNRAWDTSCWSCPGWFAPNVARKLFTATTEYARRGSFNLVFPSLELEMSKFLDTELSEHDIAFDRYLKSLSRGYSNLEDFPVSDRAVVCVYREHCSNHGDCVNGMCLCDSSYEGRTCYIPKDFDQAGHVQHETGDTGGQDAETWKEKVENLVWNRGDSPEGPKRPMPGAGDSSSGLVFMIVLLCVLLFVLYRVFVAHGSGAGSELPHDGKAM